MRIKDSQKEKEEKRRKRAEGRAKRAGELYRSLDLPETIARGLPCIRLFGDAHLEIENYTGVLELRDALIRVYTAIGILRISGKNLQIRDADRENMLIDGRIIAVEYEK